MKRLVLIIALFVTASAHAQVKITTPNNVFNLAYHAWYVEDRTGKLDIHAVTTGSAKNNFKEVAKSVCNFGMTASAYWVKCTLRNETGDSLFLELGNPTLTDVQLYELDSAGLLVKQHHSGNWQPFKNWVIKDLNYRIPLYAPTNKTETFFLRVQHYRGTQFTLKAGSESALNKASTPRRMFEMVYYGIIAVMVFYNFFIYLILKDKAYLYYVLYTFLMGILNAVVNGDTFKYLWPGVPVFNQLIDIISCLVAATSILFAIHFLLTRQNSPVFHKLLRTLLHCYLATILIIIAERLLLPGNVDGMVVIFAAIALISTLLVFALILAGIVVYRGGYQPALFYLFAWSFLLGGVIVFILKDFDLLPYNFFTVKSMQVGSAAEALLLSMALANRINLLKKEKEEAQFQTVQSLEENKKLITEQNLLLEKKVEERTQELKQTNRQLITAIQHLEETQTQLVQREKMASLGELTAGIAHEIKNPLNFINNFSDINTELIDELKNELQADNKEGVFSLADDIKQNQQKISAHGKRADSIVKGMLQHARASSGRKEPTDINALTEECMRLSFDGLKTKDQPFNAIFSTSFDESLGNIEVDSQEIGRVLLNLFSNALYSVNEKKRQMSGAFEPRILVSTKKEKETAEIVIKDNGLGIPKTELDKIFQPFFTTKPTGQGTGLGLSLSYDIIKAHGGKITVDSQPGEYAEFKIYLPALT